MAKIIARRKTSDGHLVHLWSDGDLTWALGRAIRGVRLPRNGDLTVGWAVLGEVELYDASEVLALIKAAQRGGLPGEIRHRFDRAAGRRAAPRLDWQVLQTDRDGRPTARVARLPRIAFGPGLAIWHERGRYDVVREHPPRSDTYENTGFSFSTLEAALKAASEIRAR
jgi:hypothetical protein